MASLYEISAHYCRNVCILCAAGVLYQALSFVLHLVLKLGASFFASLSDTNTGRIFGGVVVGSLIASGPLHLNVSDFKQFKEILKKNL
ncbi:hypothetical protein P8452_57390 [Trifolium repens]|nr:hypothetical protein P8452_57390 [Trifolium repens]